MNIPVHYFKKNYYLSLYEKYNDIIFYTLSLLSFYSFIFDHGKIDFIRIPFLLTIISLIYLKKIHIRDIFDNTILLILSYFILSIISNLYNHQPIKTPFSILNWTFPYLLAKLSLRNGKTSPKILIYIICTLILGLAFIGIISHIFSIDSLFGKDIFRYGQFTFTMSNPNRAGFYLAISILLLTTLLLSQSKHTKKDAIIFCLPIWITFFALLMTQEKKSILSIPFFILTIIIFSKKYKLLMAAILIGAFVLITHPLPKRVHISNISMKSNTVSARLSAWEIATHLFIERPLIGHGFGSFKETSIKYYNAHQKKIKIKPYYPLNVAHNINLNTLAETGVIGFFILNTIFILPFFITYKKKSFDFFSISILIIIFFIYLQLQFSNFIKASHRIDITFFILGIYSC